ncbi:uncharacterized protein LOC127073503 isoform X1 [Lathyrus oleraceus]|uniref:BSD domain-containing protein n=1 Tax=Pisum sativum TaxID=3888 RepID=A0A9D4X7R5_PEA|nr:uncharacterized protein LOC127073503 isoform X1 [Pisum sativum]KAI5416144.1 hypothetical protein KIW84_041259 [Pisum sativum]
MSWLFNSNHPNPESSNLHPAVINSSPPPLSTAVDHGVKDDLSIIFRGVANFLAPPPSSSSSSSSGESTAPSSKTLTGIRNDLVEIGGSFRSSLSLLSPRKAVTGISKLASQLLLPERDHEEVDGGAVPGATEDVVRFVKEISTRPECWTEFPFPLHNADCSLSNSQREHALAIEQLVPEFVTLRMNLCSYMNVEKFWMIYFLLILPRLNQHDFECLSTPKIVEARDVLLRKLEERNDTHAGECEKSGTMDTHQEGREDSGTESITFDQNQMLTDATSAIKGLEIDDTINSEKWLTDTDIDATSLTSCTKHQEDISFSDLEEYGSYSSDNRLSSHGEVFRGSSPEGSSGWVQLHENKRGGRPKAIRSKGKDSEDESNDWLAVDEFH